MKTLFILLLLITGQVSVFSQADSIIDKNTGEIFLVKDGEGYESVVPYGEDRVITLESPKLLNDKVVEIPYKFENPVKEPPMLYVYFIGGNISGQQNHIYYLRDKVRVEDSYDWDGQKLKFVCKPLPPTLISGKVKVYIFFISKNGLFDDEDKISAISNVTSLFINY